MCATSWNQFVQKVVVKLITYRLMQNARTNKSMWCTGREVNVPGVGDTLRNASER